VPAGAVEQLLGWVVRAFDCFCKLDVVCDLVDQACWLFEALAAPELQFNQDSVEKGASIAQNCPGDPSIDIGCEGVPNIWTSCWSRV
jgi:hypothetical protein